MEKELPKVLKLLRDRVICWIFYPKGTSGIQTDLTRDKGWGLLLKEDLKWVSLISFDETWSAFGMRLKTDADRKQEARPKSSPVFDYIDPVRKRVKLPKDFEQALKADKNTTSFFDSLSFTNKKEYIEWIVTAKRKETRENRVQASIERLGKQWKNPANR